MQLIQNETHFSLSGTKEELKLLKDIIVGADAYKYGHKECVQLYEDITLNKPIIHTLIAEYEDGNCLWEVSFPKTTGTLGRKDLDELFPNYRDCFFSTYLYEKNGRYYYRVGGYKK